MRGCESKIVIFRSELFLSPTFMNQGFHHRQICAIQYILQITYVALKLFPNYKFDAIFYIFMSYLKPRRLNYQNMIKVLNHIGSCI